MFFSFFWRPQAKTKNRRVDFARFLGVVSPFAVNCGFFLICFRFRFPMNRCINVAVKHVFLLSWDNAALAASFGTQFACIQICSHYQYIFKRFLTSTWVSNLIQWSSNAILWNCNVVTLCSRRLRCSLRHLTLYCYKRPAPWSILTQFWHQLGCGLLFHVVTLIKANMRNDCNWRQKKDERTLFIRLFDAKS